MCASGSWVFLDVLEEGAEHDALVASLGSNQSRPELQKDDGPIGHGPAVIASSVERGEQFKNYKA